MNYVDKTIFLRAKYFPLSLLFSHSNPSNMCIFLPLVWVFLFFTSQCMFFFHSLVCWHRLQWNIHGIFGIYCWNSAWWLSSLEGLRMLYICCIYDYICLYKFIYAAFMTIYVYIWLSVRQLDTLLCYGRFRAYRVRWRPIRGYA